jgi:hypothetical protein
MHQLGSDEHLLRRLLFFLTLGGALGLIAELVLLEHTESVWQWIPIVLLGAALLAGAIVWRRPGRHALASFRGVMLLCIAAGLLGLYLHYQGNVEWELESDPAARGADLLWRSLRGATPALAPGALAQLGLLGLLYTFRHPALRRLQTAPSRETR